MSSMARIARRASWVAATDVSADVVDHPADDRGEVGDGDEEGASDVAAGAAVGGQEGDVVQLADAHRSLTRWITDDTNPGSRPS
ncbi:hypothetical protein [Streptomyces sp. NPDC002537]